MRNKNRYALLFVLLALSAGSVLAASKEKPALPVAAKAPPVLNEFIKGASFTGSASCLDCHKHEHKVWSGTWHAKMLRKISPDIVVANFNNFEITYSDVEALDENNLKKKISPTIRLKRENDDFLLTLIDKDDEANNQTYKLVYVLGGNWEQQFEAMVGATFYPSPMRWVVADGQWRSKAFSEIWWIADGSSDGRPRKPEEMRATQSSDTKCDGCHTTGLKPVKDSGQWKLPNRDNGLGIGCEKCHGPGGKHIELQTKESIINPLNLNAIQQDQLCGQCHSRVTNKIERDLVYPTEFFPGDTTLPERVEFWTYSTQPGNFWPNEYANKNRQQFHDTRNTTHAREGVTCSSCHTAHAATRAYAGLRADKDGTCRQCHLASVAIYDQSPHAKAGVACTDCHMAKIGNRSGSTQKVKEHWDVSSHTYNVVTPYEAESYKMRSSCDSCHKDDRAKRGALMAQEQNAIQSRIADVRTVLSKRKADDIKTLKARGMLNVVLADGSLGAHNPTKATELLRSSMKTLQSK
jgi:predicted CXXCH cytochrome family protein